MIYFGGRRNTFEDLLNPDDMPSKEEAGLEDSGESSHIFLVDVTEVVKKFSSGKGPAVAEIQYTEDFEGCGQDSTWGWKTSAGVPIFKKGDRRVCSNYEGLHFFASRGKPGCKQSARK